MRNGQGHADLAGHRNLPDQRAASARDKNRRALGCSSARCGLPAAGQARTWPRPGLPHAAAVRSIPGAPPRGSQASPQALAPARSIERNPPAETFFSHFSHFFHYFLHFVPRTSRMDSLNLPHPPRQYTINSSRRGPDHDRHAAFTMPLDRAARRTSSLQCQMQKMGIFTWARGAQVLDKGVEQAIASMVVTGACSSAHGWCMGLTCGGWLGAVVSQHVGASGEMSRAENSKSRGAREKSFPHLLTICEFLAILHSDEHATYLQRRQLTGQRR